MGRPGPRRRIASAAVIAVVGALAGAAVGCGREGDLVASETTTAPRTTTVLTVPATGTTPLTATTPQRGRETRTTATTPDDEPAPGTTTAAPDGETGTATTTTTPREPAAAAIDATQLRRTAAEHARDRFRLPVTSEDVTLVRSRRKPRWAIASGTYGRTPWVVWLRDGKVALGTTDPERFNPIAVPCDVRPAFSEPSC